MLFIFTFLLLLAISSIVIILNVNFVNDIFQEYYINWNNKPNEYHFSSTEVKYTNFLANNKFVDSFHFELVTSAYQCEGAWNVTGMT